MLASNLRLGVNRLRLSGRPNQSAMISRTHSARESVIAGPILAVFAVRNSVALPHEHCADAIGRLS